MVPRQRQSNVPICNRGGLRNGSTLAFAEGLELAKSRRQQVPSITTGLHPKPDMKLPMSALPLITSGVGVKAAVAQGWRLRPLMILNGHSSPTPNGSRGARSGVSANPSTRAINRHFSAATNFLRELFFLKFHSASVGSKLIIEGAFSPINGGMQ
ncbi:MAG: hypothetical protein ACI8S3_001166 [Alphaproteobacteria bacterium]|jgi:hypothetical protein